jgi:hypothetical protein
MITEDYVSLETAKLLKEKGFDGEWHKHYWGYEPGKEFLTSGSYNSEYDYPAPTLQTAMKWLRKTHNLFCDLGYDDLGYFWSIINLSEDSDKQPVYASASYGGYSEYEDACEAAIKYCLEHLKQLI